MILDNPEVSISIENSIYAEENCMTEFVVNYEALEKGERYLNLPEGLKGICKGAFEEYNTSGVIQNISRMLVVPEDYIAEWSKKIIGKKIVKITFPPEAGTSVRERASYLVEKEKRIRLLRLNIPASIERIQPDAFPALLERITVSEENPVFCSREGLLFNKDEKILIRYPGYRGEECCCIPEGVEVLAAGAFSNGYLQKLVLPSSLKKIEQGSFKNTVIKELVFLGGPESIEKDCFEACDIKKLVLAKSIRKLEDYAFRGMTGISEFVCDSDEISVGVGLFSEGRFENIEWWPWDEISPAAFLNSNIKTIVVPEGVSVIKDYAFAGCYRADKIVLPDTVTEIGAHSFDEGSMYSGDVELSENLYKFAYRFPAMSTINGKRKSEIWQKKAEQDFCEEEEILREQAEALKQNLSKLKFMQMSQKRKIEKELGVIAEMLSQ